MHRACLLAQAASYAVFGASQTGDYLTPRFNHAQGTEWAARDADLTAYTIGLPHVGFWPIGLFDFRGVYAGGVRDSAVWVAASAYSALDAQRHVYGMSLLLFSFRGVGGQFLAQVWQPLQISGRIR